jgi:PIN domain nuclease of toxin-antitoxin system
MSKSVLDASIVLALVRTLQVEAFTADRVWSKLELAVPVRLIR